MAADKEMRIADKRMCFVCYVRIFGYSHAASSPHKLRNMQDKIKELTELLEEYLPPHLIEEVRMRILDIITTMP